MTVGIGLAAARYVIPVTLDVHQRSLRQPCARRGCVDSDAGSPATSIFRRRPQATARSPGSTRSSPRSTSTRATLILGARHAIPSDIEVNVGLAESRACQNDSIAGLVVIHRLGHGRHFAVACRLLSHAHCLSHAHGRSWFSSLPGYSLTSEHLLVYGERQCPSQGNVSCEWLKLAQRDWRLEGHLGLYRQSRTRRG